MMLLKYQPLMRNKNLIILFLFAILSFAPGNFSFITIVSASPYPIPVADYTGFPETFETGTKSAYTYGTVSLTTGTWGMDDALIGNTASDVKEGLKSVRIRNTGKLTMLFDVTTGTSKVVIQHAMYGTDTSATWGLWYSINGGSNWTQAGSNVTSNTHTLVQTSFAISLFGNVRYEIRKVSGGRINIDNITITDNSGTCCCGCASGSTDSTAARDNVMLFGNPSAATTALTDSNNYLIEKHQFALAYNNSQGIARWVGWHLNNGWLGAAERCDCFAQDSDIPAGYYRAATSHYTGSGFDRGHLCPSDDRDASDSDNAATFRMSNIAPQAPQLNQIPWVALENYCRTLIDDGNELYIFSGGYGSGGVGSLGDTTYTISSGRITVPSHFWKVILVLPVGTNDVSRVTTTTRVIAVNMPNVQAVSGMPWTFYRTSTDAIEMATGYDFFSEVPAGIQAVIEAAVDTVTVP
jgi:endonuclease G, mitochondrial